MLKELSAENIYIVCGHTDMRKSIDGLAAIVTSAVNGNSLTPALMVEIQDNINYACAAVEEHAPEKVKTMQEGVNKLWQKLM